MGMKNYELKAINDCLDVASNLFKTEKTLKYSKLVNEGVMTKAQAENLKNRKSNVVYHEIVKAIKANQDTDFPWTMSSFLKFLRKTENGDVSAALEMRIRAVKEEQMQLDKDLENHGKQEQIEKDQEAIYFKKLLLFLVFVISVAYGILYIIFYGVKYFFDVFVEFPTTFLGFLLATVVSEFVKYGYKYLTTNHFRQQHASNNKNNNNSKVSVVIA